MFIVCCRFYFRLLFIGQCSAIGKLLRWYSPTVVSCLDKLPPDGASESMHSIETTTEFREWLARFRSAHCADVSDSPECFCRLARIFFAFQFGVNILMSQMCVRRQLMLNCVKVFRWICDCDCDMCVVSWSQFNNWKAKNSCLMCQITKKDKLMT